MANPMSTDYHDDGEHKALNDAKLEDSTEDDARPPDHTVRVDQNHDQSKVPDVSRPVGKRLAINHAREVWKLEPFTFL